MSVIDDLKAAVVDYPNAKVDISIVSFTPVGTVANVGEVFQFKVRLVNNGELDMTAVVVCVHGSTYAEVSTTATGPWTSGFVQNPTSFTVNAHQTYTTGWFYGKAKAVTSGAKAVVSPHLISWDAKLDHILNGHSGSGPYEGALTIDISPA